MARPGKILTWLAPALLAAGLRRIVTGVPLTNMCPEWAPDGKHLTWLAPALLLLLSAGCSGANLGDIDESVDSREEMPGPGILADENGDSALKWSTASKEPEATRNSYNGWSTRSSNRINSRHR